MVKKTYFLFLTVLSLALLFIVAFPHEGRINVVKTSIFILRDKAYLNFEISNKAKFAFVTINRITQNGTPEQISVIRLQPSSLPSYSETEINTKRKLPKAFKLHAMSKDKATLLFTEVSTPDTGSFTASLNIVNAKGIVIATSSDIPLAYLTASISSTSSNLSSTGSQSTNTPRNKVGSFPSNAYPSNASTDSSIGTQFNLSVLSSDSASSASSSYSSSSNSSSSSTSQSSSCSESSVSVHISNPDCISLYNLSQTSSLGNSNSIPIDPHPNYSQLPGSLANDISDCQSQVGEYCAKNDCKHQVVKFDRCITEKGWVSHIIGVATKFNCTKALICQDNPINYTRYSCHALILIEPRGGLGIIWDQTNSQGFYDLDKDHNGTADINDRWINESATEVDIDGDKCRQSGIVTKELQPNQIVVPGDPYFFE